MPPLTDLKERTDIHRCKEQTDAIMPFMSFTNGTNLIVVISPLIFSVRNLLIADSMNVRKENSDGEPVAV